MRIIIKATNLKLTPSIKNHIEEKIGSLEKFTQKIETEDSPLAKSKPLLEVWVEVGKVSRHHRKGDVFRAEAQIRIPGREMRVEATEDNLFLAINEVKDGLQRDLKKYSDKRTSLHKRGSRSIKKLLNLSPLARFRRKK